MAENEKIRTITSFTIDHDKLMPGFYISRIDGDITTYDLRTRRPNMGDYMDNLTMHSVEHMFATYARNMELSDDVIYFGPMGCQTGFYFLMKNQTPEAVFSYVKRILKAIIAYEGPVFGAVRRECGNYRDLNLEAAQIEAQRYLDVLEDSKHEGFGYDS